MNYENALKLAYQAEYFVLSGCLKSVELAYEAIRTLEIDDFLPGTEHRQIFKAIKSLMNDENDVNRVSISQRVPAEIGEYIAMLNPFSVLSERQFIDYLTQVKEFASKRKLLNLTNRIGKESQDGSISDVVNRLIVEAHAIADRTKRRGGINMDDAVQEHDNFVDALIAGEIKTISGPLPGLEEITLYPGNQVIIGAHTSVGKSAFAIHWATILARNGLRVLFISGEMTQVEMVQRVASDVAGLGIGLMRSRGIKLSGHRDFLKFRDDIRESGGELKIRYIPGANEIDISAELDAMTVTGGTDALFVDYIQALECHAASRKSLREQIGYLSRWFRKQGDVRGMVTIVMSQLSRPGKEDRYSNRPPTIWDLKESGNLENDPDVVILLHREKSADYRNWNIQVMCVKNRNGSLCDQTYEFDSWKAQWR